MGWAKPSQDKPGGGVAAALAGVLPPPSPPSPPPSPPSPKKIHKDQKVQAKAFDKWRMEDLSTLSSKCDLASAAGGAVAWELLRRAGAPQHLARLATGLLKAGRVVGLVVGRGRGGGKGKKGAVLAAKKARERPLPEWNSDTAVDILSARASPLRTPMADRPPSADLRTPVAETRAAPKRPTPRSGGARLPYDLVQCKHCQRKFAPNTHMEHEPQCGRTRAKPTTLKKGKGAGGGVIGSGSTPPKGRELSKPATPASAPATSPPAPAPAPSALSPAAEPAAPAPRPRSPTAPASHSKVAPRSPPQPPSADAPLTIAEASKAVALGALAAVAGKALYSTASAMRPAPPPGWKKDDSKGMWMYEIEKGDYSLKLSRQFGSRWERIKAQNAHVLGNPKRFVPGAKLYVDRF